MYGLIGRLKAAEGQREALVEILVSATEGMPGCRAYVVARDLADETSIWITEVWESREAHAASLLLPAVRAAIEKARPLMAGFGERFETEPASRGVQRGS